MNILQWYIIGVILLFAVLCIAGLWHMTGTIKNNNPRYRIREVYHKGYVAWIVEEWVKCSSYTDDEDYKWCDLGKRRRYGFQHYQHWQQAHEALQKHIKEVQKESLPRPTLYYSAYGSHCDSKGKPYSIEYL
jgi:hypothetical protein